MKLRIVASVCLVISLCLASSLADKLFTPEEKENPLKFVYRFPIEQITNSVNAPPPAEMAIILPLQKDICCDKEAIKFFNRKPDDYVLNTVLNAHRTIKEDYLEKIGEIQTRLCEVMKENLRIVVWVKMVNFFNKNLNFREWLLTDKPLVPGRRLQEWDYRIYAQKINKFLNNAAFPDNVGIIDPSEIEGINTAVKVSLPETCKNEDVISKCQTRDTPELCLQNTLLKRNERFHLYEEIIDLVRKAFDQTERGEHHAHLFNPAARWYT